MVRADGGVGGVNGDFFDISDTGAPIGVGVKDGVTLHGPAQPLGWNISFVIGADGTPAIRRSPDPDPRHRPTQAARQQRQRPARDRAGHRPLHLRAGARLRASACSTVPPPATCARWSIRDGRVVSNTRTVWRDREIDGRLLLGRGRGADTLRRALPGRHPDPGRARHHRLPGRRDLGQRRAAARRRRGHPRRRRAAPPHRGGDRRGRRAACCCSSSTAARTSAAATRWWSWPG